MLTIKRIWVPGYRPFVMGGHVHYTLAADIECEGPFDMGKGIEAYTATSPTGKVLVVDSVSLGVIGPSLEEVRADVAEADIATMRKQQDEAKLHYEQELSIGAVEVCEPGYLWIKAGGLT
jgi:hypothetical protein